MRQSVTCKCKHDKEEHLFSGGCLWAGCKCVKFQRSGGEQG